MSRSVRKGPFVDGHLLKKVEKMNAGNKKLPIQTWSRRSMIIPDFVGHTFNVHNGKSFTTVSVSARTSEKHVAPTGLLFSITAFSKIFQSPSLASKPLFSNSCLAQIK